MLPATARSIFDNYNHFLAILDDADKRTELECANSDEDLRNSKAWEEVRSVSRPFHDGLVALFLSDDEPLRTLTMKYGVF